MVFCYGFPLEFIWKVNNKKVIFTTDSILLRNPKTGIIKIHRIIHKYRRIHVFKFSSVFLDYNLNIYIVGVL